SRRSERDIDAAGAHEQQDEGGERGGPEGEIPPPEQPLPRRGQEEPREEERHASEEPAPPLLGCHPVPRATVPSPRVRHRRGSPLMPFPSSAARPAASSVRRRASSAFFEPPSSVSSSSVSISRFSFLSRERER